jgi:hypothetical protein
VQAYAKTIQTELVQASRERSEFRTLTDNVNGCHLGARQALPTIKHILKERQAVVAAVEQLPAPAGARDVQNLFLASFRASMDADKDYLNWLNAIQADYRFRRPCTLESLAEYEAFVRDSAKASRVKQEFVDVIDPILRKYRFNPSDWTNTGF